MDYLQYRNDKIIQRNYWGHCFKPCYKWITFNTQNVEVLKMSRVESFKPCYKWITFNTIGISQAVNVRKLIEVLNLVINGLPSIQKVVKMKVNIGYSFKPCYKWITFNTINKRRFKEIVDSYVLNLVINGLPSIP